MTKKSPFTAAKLPTSNTAEYVPFLFPLSLAEVLFTPLDYFLLLSGISIETGAGKARVQNPLESLRMFKFLLHCLC